MSTDRHATRDYDFADFDERDERDARYAEQVRAVLTGYPRRPGTRR